MNRLPAALLTSAFVIGAASAQASSPSPFSPPRLDLRACQVEGIAEQARCGVFQVREDRSDPRSPLLPLRVVVVPAKSGHPAPEPVFYFEGGPGQPATESAGYLADAWFRADNDVVLIDQRGTGPGHRLDCAAPGSDTNLQGYLDKPYAAFAACGRELAKTHDLAQYVTPVAMQDADDIRRALGYGRINLYGASYGSRAAIVYAKLFPEHVRTIYLSGVVPLEIRMPLYFPWSVQRAVDASLKQCATKADCAVAYPKPAADLDAVKQRLKAAPARVAIKNPVSGRDETVTFTEWGFVSAILWKLYVAGAPEDLPRALKQARDGDYRELVEGWVATTRASRSSTAWGLNRAINCMEDVPRIRPGEIEQEAAGSFYGPTMGLATVKLCKSWPHATYPAGFFAPFRSDIPVMVTSGEFDPVTPPRWGEVARRSFPNSFHLVTLQGHSNFQEDGCLGEVAGEFLRTGSVSNLDLSCVQEKDSGLTLLP